MKCSEKWLREWANPPVDISVLAEQLTLSGLEVDSIVQAAPDFNGVVIGHVISVQPHPNADRLSFCQVEINNHHILEIVCGAPNVRAGLKVAVVVVDGTLPGGIKVKKTKLRGVVSHGMICSERELGLSEQDTGGILELPADAPIGKDFREYFQLNDYCLDVALTPNRGDCASVLGISREVAAINHLREIQLTVTEQQPVKIQTIFPVILTAKKECPRYVGRIIRDIHPDRKTPIWMRERLRRSGFRSIHPVVDVMNYVMLELGQPMHAFDLDQLDKGIEIRLAKNGETIQLIDGQEITLAESTLIIADHQQPQAIAGVMGGAASAVSENTRHVFLESAFFSPPSISLTARYYGIQSESSYRFERGVDWQLQTKALERATQLLLQIVGGEAGPLVEKASKNDLPTVQEISLRGERIKRLLGIRFEGDEIKEILTALGMSLEQASSDEWKVKAPSYRFDLTNEADVIEELARIYGYHRIPAHRLKGEHGLSQQSETVIETSRLMRALVDRSYHEVVTYSFIDEKLQRLINPSAQVITVSNPIASDMATMRASLWPGLLKVLQYNQNRGVARVRLFELGACFDIKEDCWHEETRLSGLATGTAHALQWGKSQRLVDFFDVKGDVSNLLALTRRADYHWVDVVHPALHPGQSAGLYQGHQQMGWIGVLHPRIVAELDLNHPPVLFEFQFDAVSRRAIPQYHPVSKYPAVTRDIAIVVDKAVSAQEIEQKVAEICGQLLIAYQIFDIYVGEGIEYGKKSVALGLTFQGPSRTLTDEEINQLIDRVVVALGIAFNATLRA